MKEQKSKTLTSYKRLKGARVSLYAGAIASPIVPATIVTIVNWQDWFADCGYSLPYGFACLILTVVFAIVGVLKSGAIFKKTDVALYFLSGIFMCVGLTCMFLASLLFEMGSMWLYTGAGLIASGACVTVEKKAIEPNISFYKKLIEDNNLDNKSKRKLERQERAKQEAEAEAKYLEEKRKRATE